MEFCSNRVIGHKIRAVLFDFDGTFSTLRCGWEDVMRKLMLNVLTTGKDDTELEKTVNAYIDYSTGIQTVKQMKWLMQQSLERTGKAKDMWDYKADYNAMLMDMLADKKRGLEDGIRKPEEFLVAGSEKLLQNLPHRAENHDFRCLTTQTLFPVFPHEERHAADIHCSHL